MDIEFLLNGETIRLTTAPTRTLLEWLREERDLKGTKEGCNEGDCGACTVVVQDESGIKALNACILFLPQLHGKAVRTVEALGSNGLHPVQTAMIEHHGSQCGFCTPGIVASLVAGHAQGRTDYDTVLAGNLCRCTGYAPIIRAAQAAEGTERPEWIEEDRQKLSTLTTPAPFAPQTSDELAAWYVDHPDAQLIAGATDVGLWVTKQLRDLPSVAFLGKCTDLQDIRDLGDHLWIGAAVTMTALRSALLESHPAYAELVRRYASEQVRNAATIGGNIANGSPIGDNPPALIAMGAQLQLRQGDARRNLALEDFFIDYGKQDRRSGEFVEAVLIPKIVPDLKCYKISKRFDQDISAVLGCFNVTVENGTVTAARIAFGGMAATPKLATHAMQAMVGETWSAETINRAKAAMDKDFRPISDMRASAGYRLGVAKSLFDRYFAERAGQAVNVLEVRA